MVERRRRRGGARDGRPGRPGDGVSGPAGGTGGAGVFAKGLGTEASPRARRDAMSARAPAKSASSERARSVNSTARSARAARLRSKLVTLERGGSPTYGTPRRAASSPVAASPAKPRKVMP
jgi:hypothetical protein